MEESVFQPLGLNRTSIRKPDNDSLGVIPQRQSMCGSMTSATKQREF
jgi:CubicO group peptidase (beta-lactamase class C family)